MTSPAAWVLIAPIRFYQRFITPYTPASCRHHPTCSAYAVTALRVHGAVVGSGLTIWRLLRCNPWSAGGIDYVPAKGEVFRRHPTGRHAADLRRPDERPADERPVRDRERETAPASSSTAFAADHSGEDTDCTPDAPPTEAGDPMIGRSAA